MKTIKNNPASVLVLSFLVFLTFVSGIYRHDVNEEKYLKLAQEEQFECVGKIYKDTLKSGSCVFIGDRFVLSAAHVFIDRDTRPDTMELDGQTVVAYVSYNQRVTDVAKLYVVFKGQKIKVKNLTLHPLYLDSIHKNLYDIAILELEQPLKSIMPAKYNISFDELNSNVVGVGYGASGPADELDSVSRYNKKIAGENVVDSIGGQKYMGIETVLFCDFDHPTRKDCNKLGSQIPRELEYVSSGGDSGGGLFRKNAGKWELIGLCSGVGIDIGQLMKTGYYGQIMEWTRISVFASWIVEETR